MISIDTNILVRVVTQDDTAQAEIALKVLEAPSLYVSKTVLLELEWVLRYSYQLDRTTIAETLLRLLGLQNLEVEDRTAVLRAYAWYADGLDFADALHLASSGGATKFVTFDRRLASGARQQDTLPEVELPSLEA